MSPSVPTYGVEGAKNGSNEFYMKQVRLACKQLENTRGLGRTRSTLKLYSKIDVGKLGKFLGSDSGGMGAVGDVLRLKKASIQMEGSRKGGEEMVVSQAEVGFHVVGDEVRVEGGKREARTDKYFVKNLQEGRETRGTIKGIRVGD